MTSTLLSSKDVSTTSFQRYILVLRIENKAGWRTSVLSDLAKSKFVDAFQTVTKKPEKNWAAS